MTQPETGTLHHVELWVPDLERAVAEWGWLLGRLGHDRLRPGLNHLAFHAGSRRAVDAITIEAPVHGWTLLFADRHPHAGGPGHYAAYLANTDGFEAELVG